MNEPTFNLPNTPEEQPSPEVGPELKGILYETMRRSRVPRLLITNDDLTSPDTLQILYKNDATKTIAENYGYETFDEAVDEFLKIETCSALYSYNNDPVSNGRVVFIDSNSHSAERKKSGFLKLNVVGSDGYVYDVSVTDPTPELSDELTGTLNRKAMSIMRGSLNYKLLRDPNYRVTLVLADGANLKVVNDVCGHSFGDHILQEITACLATSTREGDMIFRMGGDEFTIPIENVGDDTATELRQRIYANQEEYVEERDRVLKERGIINRHFPDRILDCSVLSSDSAMFDEERQLGVPVTIELMEAVADRMRYSIKEAAKISDVLNDVVDQGRSTAEVLLVAQKEILKLMQDKDIIANQRVSYYDRLIEGISAATEQLNLSADDLDLLKFVLYTHEVGSNIDANINNPDKEYVVNPKSERHRIPVYSQIFMAKVFENTGLDIFGRAAEIVEKHHLGLDGSGFPKGRQLNVDGEVNDRISHILNIIDSFYAIDNISRNKGRIMQPDEILTIMRSRQGQFSPVLLELLVPLLVKSNP